MSDLMNYQNPRHLELGIIASVMVDPTLLGLPELRALRPEYLRHAGGLWSIVQELAAEGREPSLAELAQMTGHPRWPSDLTVQGLVELDAYSLRPEELPGAVSGVLAAYRREKAGQIVGDLHRQLQDGVGRELMPMLTEAATSLNNLAGLAPRDTTSSIADDLDSAIDRILYPQNYRGVTSGLAPLDTVTGGWQPGTLNILAARPSMGKSALAGQLSQAAAFGTGKQPGVRSLMFSLEDGAQVTRMRALARMSGVAIEHGRTQPANHAPAALEQARQKLHSLRDRWLVDEESTLDGIVSACYRQHARGGLGLVVIDQLSHVVAHAPRQQADNRSQLFGYITKTLKRDVAQRLGVPVILCSQLNREVTKRGNPEPDLPDLRDSGELEQDADTVTFIHRPDYYDPTDRPGEAVLRVRKNRNGPVKDVALEANMRLFKFMARGDL
ncbi:replicative DNA helicase [Deinococcus sp. Marseille-Q6407]|uniref:replicative DNA helicase n=1 Tax=Deinococcus sp. Marseille-Q6407 TaxID=2969223 RepID=UPI0021C2458A|nr:DnaB helicase C-terminal domain-containing protein [Deinococcus sp. Marseille-Q6407]